METQTVDVTCLKWGDKVKLFGGLYEVVLLEGMFANERRLDLNEIGGHNYLELSDIEQGVTFERVLPDPEDFRVRSVSNPETFHVGFSTVDIYDDQVKVEITIDGAVAGRMSIDKADLKAVVEKL